MNLQTIVRWASLVWPIACLKVEPARGIWDFYWQHCPQEKEGNSEHIIPPKKHLDPANSVQSHLKSSEFLLTELVAFLTTYNATEPGMFYPLTAAHIRTIATLIWDLSIESGAYPGIHRGFPTKELAKDIQRTPYGS